MQLPSDLNDPELSELIRCTKFTITLELAGNTRMNVGSPKTTFAKPLNSTFSTGKKQEILTWRNTILRQVKTSIDNNLNPTELWLIKLALFMMKI